MAKSKKTTTHQVAGKPSVVRPPVTPEQRYHYVEVAAYYIAEQRGFEAGSADEDWVQAELEIDRLLAEGQLNH